MEALIVLVVLAIPGAAVAALVAAVVALQRTSRLRARLNELELKLAGSRTEPSPRETTESPVPAPPRPAPATEPAEAPQEPEEAEVPRPPAPPEPPVPREAPPLRPGPGEAGAEAPDGRPPAPPPAAEDLPWIPPSPEPPRPRVLRKETGDWERWIGVRGAAAVGGVVLALAALLLFKYSVEHGLISPAVRVSMGMAAGLLCLVLSERLHRRGQPSAAGALSGAGAVALYASLWAAKAMYGLIPLSVAAALMMLVTVACGLIAAHRRTLLTAVIGLAGGFATPLMVGQTFDRPTVLFAYILLLDAGLLWLARRRGWPGIAALCLLATLLYETLWIGSRMEASGVLFGLAILALFAVLFVASAGSMGMGTGDQAIFAAGSLLAPMALALHAAARAELQVRPAPLALVLALLTGMAVWLARRRAAPSLALAGAGGSLGVALAWFATNRLTPGLAWEAVASWTGLALAVHLVSSHRARPGERKATLADPLLAGGLFLLTGLASLSSPEITLWCWLSAWVVLSALLVAHAVRLARPLLVMAAATLSSLSLGFLVAERAGHGHVPAEQHLLMAALAMALAWQALSAPSWAERLDPWAGRAAALAPLLLLLVPLALFKTGVLRPLLVPGTATALVVVSMLAATRLRDGRWFAAAVAAMAVVQTGWAGAPAVAAATHSQVITLFLVAAATVVLLTVWPALAHPAFAASREAWAAAALAGPLCFLPLKELWIRAFGAGAVGALPLALAVLTLLVFQGSRTRLRATPVRRSATIWLLAVTLSLVSVAIPLQLEKSWITIGWAVNGAAVLLLWRRFDVPGLKYFGLGLLGAAAVRLTLNPAVLGYHPRGRWPVLNWVLYTYWVPAASLIFGWKLLKDREVERLRSWEEGLFRRHAGGAAACGLAALAVIFAWINLAVVDLFSTGPTLVFSMERQPARDLAFSIAWAVYALAILALGMRWRNGILRWLSLGLLVVTLGKVFLYDLGRLQDLYRVGSLVGLAVSLILVSLAYQRFVLRRDDDAPSADTGEVP